MIRKLVKLTGGKVNVLDSNDKLICQLQSELTFQPNTSGEKLIFYKDNVENPQLVAEWADLQNSEGVSLGNTIELVAIALGQNYFFKSGSTGGAVTADDVTPTASHRVITAQEGVNIGIHGMTEKVAPLNVEDEIGVWDSLTLLLRRVTLASFKAVILGWIGNTLKHQGNWSPTTNTPTLTNNDPSKASMYWVCTDVASRFGFDWKVGDWIIYNADGVIELSDNSSTTRSELGLDTGDSPNFTDVLLTGLGSFYGSTINSVKDGITNIASNLIPKLGSSVANSIPYFTGTDGKTLGQSANATLDASGNITSASLLTNLLKSASNTEINFQTGVNFNASSGIQKAFSITPSFAGQTGTAGWDAFSIDVTNSASTGTKNIINAKVGGSSIFSVSSSGIATVSNAVITSAVWANIVRATANNITISVQSGVSYTSSSATQVSKQVIPTISQTGTAGYSVIDINPSIMAEGSGAKYLQRWGKSSAFESVITSSYFMGMGVTTPSQRLHAHESTASTGCYLKTSNATTGNGPGVGVMFGIDTGLNGIINNQSNGYFSFLTNNTEFMRALPNGSVGIGVSAPTASLHVAGGGAAANIGGLKLSTQSTPRTTPEQGLFELIGNSLLFSKLAKRRSVVMGQAVIVADTSVNNTVTESGALITLAHGAGYLESGFREKIEVLGTISQRDNAAAFGSFKIKYAGVTIQTISTPASTPIAAGTPFILNVSTTVRTTGATGTMHIHGYLMVSGISIADFGVVTTATIDTTTAQSTTVTFQWNEANASDLMTVNQGSAVCIDGDK